MTIELDDRAIRQRLATGLRLGMEAAGGYLAEKLAEEVSVVGITVTQIKHKTGGRLKIISKHVPSEPGQPPHVQTSRLFSSMEAEVRTDADGLTLLAGTTVPYGIVLELGIPQLLGPRVAPRPWLLSTFFRNQAVLHEMILKGIRA